MSSRLDVIDTLEIHEINTKTTHYVIGTVIINKEIFHKLEIVMKKDLRFIENSHLCAMCFDTKYLTSILPYETYRSYKWRVS